MASLNLFHSGIFSAFFHGIAIGASIVNLFLLPFIVYHSIYSKTYLLNRITALESILHDLQSSQSYQLDNKLDTVINDSHIEETEVHILFLDNVMRLSRFDRIGVSMFYGLCRLFGCKPYSEEGRDRLKLVLKEKKLEERYAETMGEGKDKNDLEKGVYELVTEGWKQGLYRTAS